MRTRVTVARGDENGRSMRPSFGIVLALALSGCGAGVGTGGFDAGRASDAVAACAPTGATPQLTLVGLDPSGSRLLVLSNATAGSAFAAFVQVQHAGDAPLTGGELRPAGTSPGSYTAAIPVLRPGETYSVTVQGMQDTNRAPECQKSFALALGSFTAR